MRDIKLPIKLERLSNKLDVWQEILGPNWKTEKPMFHVTIHELEKEQEATIILLNGLKDTMQMREKTKVEMEFRSYIEKDKKLKTKYGNLWVQADDLAKERGQLEARLQFYTACGLNLLNAGVNVIRACDPVETKENKALALQQLEHDSHAYLDNIIQDNHLYVAIFVDHLNTARNWLPETDPYLIKVFNGKSGDEFLTEVYGNSIGGNKSLVAYADQRNSLVNLGWDAIKKCKDPIIVAAHELVILMRENKRLEAELDTKEEALRDELSRAFFEVYGTRVNVFNDYGDYVFDYDYYWKKPQD